jgi:uroporphyrin-III C-methyltransferase
LTHQVSSDGLVSLVGAGPGAADLLTLRAVRRLEAADVVVFDRLVDPDLLDYAPARARRISVGKAPGGVSCSQTGINALLVELGCQGLRVVRLKGGDPFVFGRGGEEALALARAGVAYEIVPGVSAALAAPAAAGIPLTQRGLAHVFMVASGTCAGGSELSESEMRALATPGTTIVLLMAVHRLEKLVGSLLRHGRSASDAAAVVQHATWSTQAVVTAPLGDIVERARSAGVAAPAVLVVGPTVALAAEIGATGVYAQAPR